MQVSSFGILLARFGLRLRGGVQGRAASPESQVHLPFMPKPGTTDLHEWASRYQSVGWQKGGITF
jgi:hypothetical protein